MNEIMTPSETISEGQIGKICGLLAAKLRKGELSSNPVQQVLETQGKQLTEELFMSIRKRVEAASDFIIRCAHVDHNRTPQQVLDATNRKQYVDNDVVAAMPRSRGGKVEIIFFKEERFITDDNLEKRFASLNLRPATPDELVAVNEADSVFADEYPNSTHWKDENDNWCYIAFGRGLGGRGVDVGRYDRDWGDGWWFAGVRK